MKTQFPKMIRLTKILKRRAFTKHENGPLVLPMNRFKPSGIFHLAMISSTFPCLFLASCGWEPRNADFVRTSEDTGAEVISLVSSPLFPLFSPVLPEFWLFLFFFFDFLLSTGCTSSSSLSERLFFFSFLSALFIDTRSNSTSLAAAMNDPEAFFRCMCSLASAKKTPVALLPDLRSCSRGPLPSESPSVDEPVGSPVMPLSSRPASVEEKASFSSFRPAIFARGVNSTKPPFRANSNHGGNGFSFRCCASNSPRICSSCLWKNCS
mmetsp:Transcript_76519/g.212514  ORF Transcript_76519/g.212514 Transcript_76519/m.212514 type:complete len:266 (+) Transcript_76519:1189-1986(+)